VRVPEESKDELEESLKRRDPRFVFRLVMLLAIVVLAALWLAGWLTRAEVGGCAARGFQGVTEPQASDPHPPAPAP